jgi:hypothetical protein
VRQPAAAGSIHMVITCTRHATAAGELVIGNETLLLLLLLVLLLTVCHSPVLVGILTGPGGVARCYCCHLYLCHAPGWPDESV